ncbi:MAG: hypothetical protein COA79_00670 [Planctomycetota bacterium]|nr:MAG: hypothetical protein COA79_00670 [Planctomycetota bacterium]
MKRYRNKEINFSFDSLADIVSNILGIMVILGVLVGMMSKFNDENKKEEEREVIFGKKDAMADLIHKDKRKNIPYERAARYNRFHLHIICWKSKMFFVDSAEFNLMVNKHGVDYFNNKKLIGDCNIQISKNIRLDVADFFPEEKRGYLPLNSKFSNYEGLRNFFKLKTAYNAKDKRNNTKVDPNNHIIHFHVFSDSINAFNIGNDYLRMLGFDTGWELIAENNNGRVRLPVFLKYHSNIKNMHIQ